MKLQELGVTLANPCSRYINYCLIDNKQ